MKIVRLKGGLGNQMFQYAFAKLLEQTYHEEVKLDFSAFSTLMDDPVRQPRLLRFKLSLPIATKKEVDKACLFPHFGKSQSNIYRLQTIIERDFNRKYLFERDRAPMDYTKIGKYNFYDGYWQAVSYIEPIADILHKEFEPKNPVSEKTQRYIDEAKSRPTTFMGVRRGDFLDELPHYGEFTNNYYRNAMKLIEEKCPGMTFLVFTNDVQWTKDNMDFSGYKVEYREKDMQVDDFEELMLMRSCQNAIISNSTFNWWGAWLIENPDKIVVCPEEWFTDNKPIDIIPDTWTKMKR